LLRKEQLIAQERNAFQLSAFATEQEVERLLKLDRQTRDIAWAELPLEPFLQAAEVSEAELEARYQAQQERFMTQPQVVLSYVELKQSDFLAPEAITPAQLQSAYQQALATFQASEERAGAHILFPEDGLEQAKEVRRGGAAVFHRPGLRLAGRRSGLQRSRRVQRTVRGGAVRAAAGGAV
jgi:peptidyl-prolyl cis-trans isomerase D